jgi:hypothetical protein
MCLPEQYFTRGDLVKGSGQDGRGFDLNCGPYQDMALTHLLVRIRAGFRRAA